MVLEKFITPSFFQEDTVRSLWDYIEYFGNDSQKIQALWDHWEHWVQEEDIRKLAIIGFTHVRIPVGTDQENSGNLLCRILDFYLSGRTGLQR
jgi:aryl-phospho-beta-D-glucosidase BglC (GH1 family)